MQNLRGFLPRTPCKPTAAGHGLLGGSRQINISDSVLEGLLYFISSLSKIKIMVLTTSQTLLRLSAGTL